MKYAVVIEKSANGYGAYSPDLPGLGVVGDSPAEVRRLIREAIELHLDEGDEPSPPPTASVCYLDVGES